MLLYIGLLVVIGEARDYGIRRLEPILLGFRIVCSFYHIFLTICENMRRVEQLFQLLA